MTNTGRWVSVTIDRVPARCSVYITRSGPITAAHAKNIDTDIAGPLVTIDETRTLAWADLDPDGRVDTR